MKKEREVRILEINESDFTAKIISMGASSVGEFLQRRYIYDVKPVNPNKWVRLRTNGQKVTLTIKEIKDRNALDGTEELEIIVDDFDKTHEILNQLGYIARNYQENLRKIYILNDVEVTIDSWPLIPTYAEIEGKTNKEVLAIVKLLESSGRVTTLDVDSIYKEYGIDVKKIKELKLR